MASVIASTSFRSLFVAVGPSLSKGTSKESDNPQNAGRSHTHEAYEVPSLLFHVILDLNYCLKSRLPTDCYILLMLLAHK